MATNFATQAFRRPYLKEVFTVEVIDFAVLVSEMLAVFAAAVAAKTLIVLMGVPLDDQARANILCLSALGIVLHTLASRHCGSHDADSRFSYKIGLPRSLRAWASTIVFLTTITIILRARVVAPTAWMTTWLVTGCLFLTMSRATIATIAQRARATGYFDRRSAIIGTVDLTQSLANYLTGHAWLTISIAGTYSDDVETLEDGSTADNAMTGGLQDLVSDIRQGRIDQVFVALPSFETQRISTIVDALKRTPVRVRCSFDPLQPVSQRHPLVMLGEMPLITTSDRPLLGLDRIVKSLSDRVFGLLALLLAAPLMAAIALAIRIEGGGPILFRQVREGYNCRPFTIWKFRTMRWDTTPSADIVQASRRDPRVTRLGTFLRCSSLDELPQLFNVVAGQMSLIGPRPHAPGTRAGAKAFADVDEDYAARHRVKPGITGWAQVCGLRGQTDTEEKLVKRLAHDLHYIENWSIGFDMYILLRTLAVVPFHRMAY